jgi:hypothetical protein
MIINIKNKTDLITLDLSLSCIRIVKDYLGNFLKDKEMVFIPLCNDDIQGYSYLFENDKKLFFESLRDEVNNFFNKRIIILKNLEVLK